MSELIDTSKRRKEVLKHMILEIHQGKAPEEVKPQLIKLLGRIPYEDVVEVEQELIQEGLPESEIIKLCDLHSSALRGVVQSVKLEDIPEGHPAAVLREENAAIMSEIKVISRIYEEISQMKEDEDATESLLLVRFRFGNLGDIDKHYQRKENLLFPYLEKKNITGPPKVMWGKHDENRENLKNSYTALKSMDKITAGEAKSIIELVLKPTTDAIGEMVFKETEIFIPLCMDNIDEQQWYSISKQSNEIGYCLYDPTVDWKPTGYKATEESQISDNRIQLPSGSFTPEEITTILNTIPFDLTFVDRDDKVRYFTQGRERIFQRNRAILGRDVQMCHPPSSVHIVEQILEDFKSGKASHAPFWINLNDQFLHIEYYALRNSEGEYLGTLEVSQNLTEKRALEGEKRILNYNEGGDNGTK